MAICRFKSWLGLGLLVSVLCAAAQAEAAADATENCKQTGIGIKLPYKSVEPLTDRRVTFRLCAPDAKSVDVIIPDIAGGAPGTPPELKMTRDDTGLWSVTTPKPIAPDTYRFVFDVDGVKLPDPLGSTFDRGRVGVVSTFEVKGASGDFQAYKAGISHGVVSVVDYWSKSLGVRRRAHVYTPPGYMKGNGNYPVLYLVHGYAMSDTSWTSLGHAQYILDNLIASGKAKPMILVMPFGHTPPRPGSNPMNNSDFGKDLANDLIPYIDAHFRTLATANDRAMAGFSMGGMHTIRFGLTRPDLFHSIGIFSMGLGLHGNSEQVTRFEHANDAALREDAKSLKLLYLAIGSQDRFYSTSAPTRAMFDKYGIRYIYHESGGGHNFSNWRRYLADFAPRLFR